MDDDAILDVLTEACAAVRAALDQLDDWGPAGTRPGQYRLDLAADAAALDVLHGAGLQVLSEESGLTGGGELLAILDPVDGSTNAHRGIPFYSTSLCVLDGEGPRAALVVNQATGVRYEAVRGAGRGCYGVAVRSSGCEELRQGIVAISGFPPRSLDWSQFRTLGAASLEFCAVADGSLDGYLLVGGANLYGWDYLGGLLVCQEAGAVVGDLDGADPVACDATHRRPVAAATPRLLAQLMGGGT